MKNNIASIMSGIAVILVMTATTSSCDDSRSYAELLTDETHYVNHFLSDNRVVGSVPADSVFETGEGAPFYQMDSEGNVYMQVIETGDMKFRPTTDDRVYFRFTRYNLARYETGVTLPGAGNSDDVAGANGLGALYFLFGNQTLASSTQYGAGIQVPMNYLGEGAKVNLVVKSQYGWTNEVANVIPFLYSITYYSSPLSPWESELDNNSNNQ